MSFSRVLFISLSLMLIPLFSSAQEQIKEFEYFKKVPQLRDALKNMDLSAFLAEKVLWIGDTTEETVSAAQVNKLLKAAVKLPKKFTISQAAETNHGYAQTFGIYNAEEIAVYFVSFRINMETQKIDEIRVVAN